MTTTQIPNRQSIRLKGWDYSNPGGYFITACNQSWKMLFIPEPVQTLIEKWWTILPKKFPTVELDAFVVMPNHIHGIIFLRENEYSIIKKNVGVDLRVNPKNIIKEGGHIGPPEHMVPLKQTGLPELNTKQDFNPTLGKIIQWFKTMITNEYIRNVKSCNWEPFVKRLFQRNYYEHIIRNDDSLNRIRHYILTNPERWKKDIENPLYRYKKGG